MPKTDTNAVSNPNATTQTFDSTASNQQVATTPSDPKNPAGAPVLNVLADPDTPEGQANEELQFLMNQDTTSFSQLELKNHYKRVHELHYLANGQNPPSRR